MSGTPKKPNPPSALALLMAASTPRPKDDHLFIDQWPAFVCATAELLEQEMLKRYSHVPSLSVDVSEPVEVREVNYYDR